MDGRHPITLDRGRQGEFVTTVLPNSSVAPRNPDDGTGNARTQTESFGGFSAIDTPLLKALDAAAALALVAPKSHDVSSSTPPVHESINSVGFSDTTACIGEGSRQEKPPGPTGPPGFVPLATSLLPGALPPAVSTQQQQYIFASKNVPAFPSQPITILPHTIAPGSVASAPVMLAHPTLPTVIPGSHQELRAAMKAPPVPAIFRDTQYRSGKWTKEEEVYADLLVELFDKGQVDEPNGSSLRGFLSRKLHCTPMRISKKYAGKGIGKLMFLSQKSIMGLHCLYGQDLRRAAEYQQNMQRLRQAEEAFYRQCCKERLDRQSKGDPLVSVSGYSSATPSTDPHVYSKPSILPPISTCAIPRLPAGVVPQGPSVASQGMPTVSCGGLPVWQQTSTSGTVLQQQYLEQPSYGIPQNVPISVRPSTTIPPTVVSTNPVPTYTPFSDQAYIGVAQALQSHSVPPITVLPTPPIAAATTVLPGETTRPSDDVGSIDYRISYQHEQKDAIGKHVPSVGASAPVSVVRELPDFLTGFENVKESRQEDRNTPRMINVEEDPSQFSPTYTSRSFDDFHRLLGRNLSPRGDRQLTNDHSSLPISENTAMNHVIPSATGEVHGFNLNTYTSSIPLQPRQSSHEVRQEWQDEAIGYVPSNSADSYPIFAQNGAFAAGQHSAYFSAKKEIDGDDLSMLLMGINEKSHQESAGSSSQIGWNATSSIVNRDGFRIPPSGDWSTPAAIGNLSQIGWNATSSIVNREGFWISPSGDRSTPAAISAEPSDQGSDEANESSGGDSNPTDGSNDSDGSYFLPSRKKVRLAMDNESIRRAIR